jgi:hypothetical protein
MVLFQNGSNLYEFDETTKFIRRLHDDVRDFWMLKEKYDLHKFECNGKSYISIGFDKSVDKIFAKAKLSGGVLKQDGDWVIGKADFLYENGKMIMFSGIIQNKAVSDSVLSQSREINITAMQRNEKDITFVIGDDIINMEYLRDNEEFESMGSMQEIWLDTVKNVLYIKMYVFFKKRKKKFGWCIAKFSAENGIELLDCDSKEVKGMMYLGREVI